MGAADHQCCRILGGPAVADRQGGASGSRPVRERGELATGCSGARGCDSLTALPGLPLGPTQRRRRADELGVLSWPDKTTFARGLETPGLWRRTPVWVGWDRPRHVGEAARVRPVTTHGEEVDAAAHLAGGREADEDDSGAVG